MYKVLMLNAITRHGVVVDVLAEHLSEEREEATQIMLHVHQKAWACAASIPMRSPKTKVTQTVGLRAKNQHPLQCTLEKE